MTKKTGACRRKLIQPTVNHPSLHAETHTSSLNPKPKPPPKQRLFAAVAADLSLNGDPQRSQRKDQDPVCSIQTFRTSES